MFLNIHMLRPCTYIYENSQYDKNTHNIILCKKNFAKRFETVKLNSQRLKNDSDNYTWYYIRSEVGIN